jgi:FMN reductase
VIGHINKTPASKPIRDGGIVGFCGSLQQPSKSRSLVEALAGRMSIRFGLPNETFDLADVFPELGTATQSNISDKIARMIGVMPRARALVVGTPVYQGSYTGLFKHSLDLVEPDAFCGLPIVLTATGGSDRHALVVEHHLRPLFAFFTAQCGATAVYASSRDFTDGILTSGAISHRIDCSVNDLAPWLELASSLKSGAHQ